MSLSDDDLKYEYITSINRIQEQYHIEYLNLNFKYIQHYSSFNYNQEYQQIIDDIVHYIFDEDQYDLIDDEYLEFNRIKKINDKLQEQDFLNYLLSQFEILRKQINKYFFQIYQDPQYQFKIEDKYKELLIGGTKDFIFLILVQTGIIINNKFQRCRLIILVLNQQDFTIFKRFEENINYKLYAAKLICNYDFNQIAIYTNQVLCLYDVNKQILIKYEMNNNPNLSIFQQTTILQIDSNNYLNQLNYNNQEIISKQINNIYADKQPYSLLQYNDFLIIYFKQKVKVIYSKNGKLLQINKNLTTMTNLKESCINNTSKLIYQTVKIDIQRSFIYQYSLQCRKILRKFKQQENSKQTDLYLLKYDKILAAISENYIEAYETIIGKQVLYLHFRNQMSPTNQLLQILNSKYLANLDYYGVKFWKCDQYDMSLLTNKLKPLNLQ